MLVKGAQGNYNFDECLIKVEWPTGVFSTQGKFDVTNQLC